jgi:ParB family chromosome partitioning protein
MTKLGKGLQSLIPPKEKPTQLDYPGASQPPLGRKESIFDIEISKIKANPYQPRHEMDQVALKELAESIKQHGILQPLIVTKNIRQTERGQETEYQLVAGHRRLEAAKLVKLPYVPAIIRDSTAQQKLELSLVENLQRADLNAIERAKAFKQLQEEFDLTHEEIAKKVGRSRESITNTLRLLNLPPAIQQALSQGKISEGHARSIAGIKNQAAQSALYEEIIQNNLSVRQIEQRAREIYVHSHQRRVAFDPEIKKIAQKIEMFLGKKVQIKKSGVGGRVSVEFENKADLESLAKKIVS